MSTPLRKPVEITPFEGVDGGVEIMTPDGVILGFQGSVSAALVIRRDRALQRLREAIDGREVFVDGMAMTDEIAVLNATVEWRRWEHCIDAVEAHFHE